MSGSTTNSGGNDKLSHESKKESQQLQNFRDNIKSRSNLGIRIEAMTALDLPEALLLNNRILDSVDWLTEQQMSYLF